jgi:4-hydroxy-tetrahydrodipicolinate synthase
MQYIDSHPNSNSLRGIIGYLITPFDVKGAPDLGTLSGLVDHLIDQKIQGIAPLGSTGESAYLSREEWTSVARTTIEATRSRVPVIVGASALTTADTVSMCRTAQDLGADAVMVLPISYWKLNDDEIFRHYQAISDAISIPIMAYNNPATAGVDMSPELLWRMVRDIEHVTMVKESSGDIQRMHSLHLLSKGALPFFNGCNPLALEAFAAGAQGWCTAAPNLIGNEVAALWEAVEANDFAAARTLFLRQLPVLSFILSGGLPATVKAGLALLDKPCGVPRLPLHPLGDTDTQKLAQLLSTVSS